ncbi:hypothetical protein EN802_32400 [bacterium M00.F.Ca.ET.159.01.1.1]|nr:hypothetical protein EN802_32400 [bacterium M00.F.Ca.ET.159.01.1.1]TGT79336.1 hypothetical protein EN800_31740 [bacterium M00.F.Ca.ET.157.01.1.1]
MTLYHSPIKTPVRSPIFAPQLGNWPGGFVYQMDFVNNVYVGGFQTYGNNTNDGRFFRDSGVSQSAFILDATGLLVNTASAGMRRSTKGTVSYQNIGTLGLWNRDFTNAVWVATNVTTAKNQTGADGSANAASSITASAANGTILQTTTASVVNRVLECWVKRITGTGTLEMTLDGGTTWQAVTSQVGSGSYGRCVIGQASVTNPVYGFRIGTSGDAFAVDFLMCHGQLQGANIAGDHYVTITSSNPGSIFHETPWALNTDAGPLSPVIKGAYAAFWQGYNFVTDVGGLWVSDGVTNCVLSAGNNVNFAANVNLTTTGAEWKPNGQLNKVAACLDSVGNMALCVNGGTVYTRTGGSLSPSATHFVLSNNGAATLPLNGWTEKFSISPNLWLSNSDLVALTK